MSALLVFLLCTTVSALSPESADVSNGPVILPELKNGIDSFTDKLTLALYKQASPNSNVVLSPINVYGTLSLLLYGADGSTRDEIAKTLEFPNSNDTFLQAHKNFGDLLASLEVRKSSKCKSTANADNCVFEDVSIASGLFVQKEYEIVTAYSEALKSYYKGAAENVDFQNSPSEATNRINKWISTKTHDLIPNLLKEPVDPNVRLVLAATLYFSAKWEMGSFKNMRTKPEKFVTEAGEVEVEYMFHEKRVPYYEGKSYTAILLNYKGKDYATAFILPNADTPLNKIMESFSKDDFHKILKDAKPKNVNYKIPCIDTDWRGDLSESLRALNLKEIFETVNLSKLISTGTRLLKVSKVTHATKLKMDEKGTVASAATYIEISLRSGRVGGPPVEFFVNRPYLMFIYHKKSSVVLFSAIIRNPK